MLLHDFLKLYLYFLITNRYHLFFFLFSSSFILLSFSHFILFLFYLLSLSIYSITISFFFFLQFSFFRLFTILFFSFSNVFLSLTKIFPSYFLLPLTSVSFFSYFCRSNNLFSLNHFITAFVFHAALDWLCTDLTTKILSIWQNAHICPRPTDKPLTKHFPTGLDLPGAVLHLTASPIGGLHHFHPAYRVNKYVLPSSCISVPYCLACLHGADKNANKPTFQHSQFVEEALPGQCQFLTASAAFHIALLTPTPASISLLLQLIRLSYKRLFFSTSFSRSSLSSIPFICVHSFPFLLSLFSFLLFLFLLSLITFTSWAIFSFFFNFSPFFRIFKVIIL
ncbi:unnamed protein product [Acanthosepion pharaonis]|uniref:Uncharacterized protein n=1 Tax=Acanthosepion pharaonis TaxID=158019 RepID=A0A812BIQ6_ACAPH|nr:unnamed protein product [Sepia pharaonis]